MARKLKLEQIEKSSTKLDGDWLELKLKLEQIEKSSTKLDGDWLELMKRAQRMKRVARQHDRQLAKLHPTSKSEQVIIAALRFILS